VGVEYAEAVGKNDGAVKGVRFVALLILRP
jgi:dynactin complex subunit